MLARGGAFSNVAANTGGSVAFVELNTTATTDAENTDFIHNGSGELEYIGLATKDFEGVIFLAGDRSSGVNILDYTLTGGVDSGGGFAPINAQRSGKFTLNNRKGCLSARYRVTLNTGDKVKPMIKGSVAITWATRGMSHVLVEVPPKSRGVAYMDPVSVFNTVSVANTFVPLTLTTLTDAKNLNFSHLGNGELEYIGADPITIEGYIFWQGRKQSGAGQNNYYIAGGLSTDGGLNYNEIIVGRTNIMQTGQFKNEGVWTNYTVTLNNGDRMRPLLRVNASLTVETYTLDHLIMEHNQ